MDSVPDHDGALLHVEQGLDIIKRALANPEVSPALWKALKDLEEKTEKT